MADLDKIDWSKIVYSKYDPDSVTTEEKMEFGAREETTLTGNIFRYGKAAFDSLTDSDLTFGQALSNIESDRQRDLYREMPQFYGITPEQEDASVLAGRVGTAIADPVTWAVPWTKVALAGKLASVTAGGGLAAVDSAARDYLTTGEVDTFNTAASAIFGGTAGGISAALARRTRFKEDYVPEKFERELKSDPLSASENDDVKKAASKAIKPESVSRLTDGKPVMSLNTQPIIDIKSSISALKRKKKKAPKKLKPEVQKEIDKQKANLKAARRTYFDNQLETYLEKEDINISMLEDLSSQGKLTDGIMSKVLYEATRPVVGGLGGYALSGIVGDEDSDGVTIGLVLSGAMLGRYARAINNSKLSSIEKETGILKISDAARKNLQMTGQYLSAGSLATRLNSIGGYAKVVGNMLFQRQGAATDSIEARVIRETRNFNTTVNTILDDSFEDESVRKLAGQIINGFDVENIQVGYRGIDGSLKPVTAEQIAEANRVAPLLNNHKNILADSVDEVGISFKREANYGMAQVYDHANIRRNLDDFYKTAREAIKLQYPKAKDETIEIKFQKFVDGVTGAEKYKTRAQLTPQNLFAGGKFRPLTDHFEKHRLITDFNARKLLAEKGYMNLDVSDVFSIYSDRTIKAREFAKTFGARGEFLQEVFSQIDKSFRGKPELAKVGNQYRKEILNAIDAYWGTYQIGDFSGSQAFVGTFTTLANTAFLTKVSIASLGDMIQPFQNSGFGAAARAILQKSSLKQPSFSKQVDFQYDRSFERELTALIAGSGDNLSDYQAGLRMVNDKFFKLIGLKFVTKTARGFAYDTGVNRAYTLANKKKLSKANLTEAKTMGLTSEDIDVLKRYTGVRQAFSDEEGRKILDRVGQKVADRDAILPMVGNRLLFTQSGNPYVRSLGQFLSWAQAKTSQINSLVQRVEDGDAALAIRSLGLTGIYGGVQYLRELAKPNYDPYDEDSSHVDDMEGAIQLSKKAMALSGNYVPWQIDKAVRTLDSVSKSGSLGSITPSISYAEDLARSFLSIMRNFEAGDYEGMAADAISVTPLAEEIVGYGSRADLIYAPQDRPNRAKGGVITDVPNVPEEPDERIDKMTGVPYDQQAGTAFVDEEDPLRRLGFKGGGEVDPLKRLGFGVGSLVGRQLTRAVRGLDDTPVSEPRILDDVPVKSDKELQADFDELTKAINKGETPKMFEEPSDDLIGSVDKEDARVAASMTEDDIAKWQEENALPQSQRQKQRPEIVEQLVDVLGGRKTIEEYRDMVDKAFPPTLYTKETAPKFPSLVEVRGGVGKKTITGGRGIIGADVPIEEGKRVSSRLDIPAYDQRNVWAVTLHEPGKSGKAFAYGQTAILKNVDFTTNPKTALDIALGMNKGTIARIEGDWVNHNPRQTYEKAVNLLDSDEWVQVGMNPFKHSYFYDKATMQPVVKAEEVIQVGPLVLVKKKGIKYASPDDEMFKVDLTGLANTDKLPLNAMAKEGKVKIGSTKFVEGGKVLKSLERRGYAGGGLYSSVSNFMEEGAAKVFGIDGEVLRKHEAQTMALVNRLVDAGSLPEHERVKVEKGRMLSGDVFNAANHMRLARVAGDSTVKRALLQGKEYVQQAAGDTGPHGAEGDRRNNSIGFDLYDKAKGNVEKFEKLVEEKLVDQFGSQQKDGK